MKKLKKQKLARENSKRKAVNYSTDKPNSKPPPGDKSLGIDPDIRFYKTEDGYLTEEVQEEEILTMHDKILTATKKNIVKRKFPYIDTFENQGPSVVRAMKNIAVRVFEHL